MVVQVAVALVLVSTLVACQRQPAQQSHATAAAVPVSAEKWVPGHHYTILVPPQPTSVGAGKVEVVEVFSYTCGACYRFEEHLSAWLESKPDYVEFVRMPVIWSDRHRAYARLYYTLQVLNRPDLHHVIFEIAQKDHNALFVDGDELRTYALQMELAQRHGIGKDPFKQAYDSPAVVSSIKRAEVLSRRYLVEGTPTIVVNGRYTTNIVRTDWDGSGRARGEVSYKALLALTDDLAASEIQRVPTAKR